MITYDTSQLGYTISDLYYFRELVLTVLLMNSNLSNEIADRVAIKANAEPGLTRYGYIESGPHIGFEYLYDHKISNDEAIKNAITGDIISEFRNFIYNTDIPKYSELYFKLKTMNDAQVYQFIRSALDLLDLSTEKVSYYRIMIT